MAGTGPIRDVGAYGISKGLGVDWNKNIKAVKGIETNQFWGAMENPLYEVAAEAMGYNWEEFKAGAIDRLGSERNGDLKVRAVVSEGVSSKRVRAGRNRWKNVDSKAPVYETMTVKQAEKRGLNWDNLGTARWRNPDGEIVFGDEPWKKEEKTGGAHDMLAMMRGKDKDPSEGWTKLHDWGIADEGLTAEMDGIRGYLTEITSINNHIPKLIREGPQGKHYGISGDIWSHYGLDKEFEAPKELSWNSYKPNLAQAKPSGATYNTPEGYEQINLHGEN